MLRQLALSTLLAVTVTACVAANSEEPAVDVGGREGGAGGGGGGDNASVGGAASGSTSALGGAASGGTQGGVGEGTGSAGGVALGGGPPIVESGGASSSAGSSAGGTTSNGASGGASSGGTSAVDGGASSDGGSSGGGSAGAGGTPSTGGGDSGGATSEVPTGLSWPIDCIPDDTCVNLDTPDTDDDGLAHDCSTASYQGHEGTDIGITWDQMDAGVSVRAAADGEVFFTADGKYDRCPNEAEPDCQRPADYLPGDNTGTNVCTELGPYCGTGTESCFWCFAGGNVIVILHDDVPGVFATRYDHLKNGSVLVSPGDRVTRGQVIAEVGSAGNSTGPHLHFEVWGTGYYELADPWAGECGPNMGPSLWASEPPWEP